MTIFGEEGEIRFGGTVHSNNRLGFFVWAPDTHMKSFLTESRDAADAKAEEYKARSRWPDSVCVREVIIVDEKTGEHGQTHLTWFPK